jgi:hypothetical protein
MPPRIADRAPTSTATTKESEPAVLAAIASAEGAPSGRLRGGGFETARLLLHLAAGIALGYGAIRLLRWRRPPR